MSAERWFARKVEYLPNGCWQWLGKRYGNGYPRWDTRKLGKRKSVLAHRFSYRMHVGEIPSDLVLDHLCRNPLCVNPAHLEPVTQQTNLNRGVDMIWMVRRQQTHCKHGHSLADAFIERKDGKAIGRKCRICTTAQKQAYRERQRAVANG